LFLYCYLLYFKKGEESPAFGGFVCILALLHVSKNPLKGLSHWFEFGQKWFSLKEQK
jgi:hypothetical protein